MSDKVRVAIRVDDAGQPVVEGERVSDDLTCEPGVAYDLERTYAVNMAIVTGTFVLLGESEEAPQPASPEETDPEFLS